MNRGMLLGYVMDLSKTTKGTCYLTNLGYKEFTGNQWNESWSWARGGKSRIKALEFTELLELYNGMINYKPSTGRFVGTDEVVSEMMDALHKNMLKTVKL